MIDLFLFLITVYIFLFRNTFFFCSPYKGFGIMFPDVKLLQTNYHSLNASNDFGSVSIRQALETASRAGLLCVCVRVCVCACACVCVLCICKKRERLSVTACMCQCFPAHAPCKKSFLNIQLFCFKVRLVIFCPTKTFSCAEYLHLEYV